MLTYYQVIRDFEPKKLVLCKSCLFILEMARHRRDDAGNTGTTFHQVTLNPGNWFNWFREPGEKHTVESADSASDEEDSEDAEEHKDAEDSDFGWTEVR